jgi:hypothetical protein
MAQLITRTTQTFFCSECKSIVDGTFKKFCGACGARFDEPPKDGFYSIERVADEKEKKGKGD